MRGAWLVAAVGLSLLAALPAGAVQSEEEGSQVYEQNCQACHQPGGIGLAGTFPPLAGNPNATDPSYVAEVVRNGRQGPIEVLGQSYDGVMPAIPTLTDAQVEAVAAHVARLATTSPTPATVPSGPPAGDPAHGERLFLGSTTLSAGGAACAGCHPAGAYGRSGLGPDLTAVAARLGGEAGLTGWLAAPPSPTMQPIFTTRPLTDSEIADLAAFLVGLDAGTTTRGPDWLLLGGFAGLAVLIGSSALISRGSRHTYADRLRSRR